MSYHQTNKLKHIKSQIFTFQHCGSSKLQLSSPNLDSALQFKDYFVNKIEPESQLAREMYESSLLASQLGTISPKLIDERKITLFKGKGKKIIAFDLDETLVHLDGKQPLIRPYCEWLLERLAKVATLVLFTAADKTHAQKMLKLIDPKQQYFSKVCTADHCIGYLKDLRVFGVDLKDILIVDNHPRCFITQLSNGVPIIPYTGQIDDEELKSLFGFLQHALKQEDMRHAITETFKLDRFHLEISGKFAVKKFYSKV